MSRPRTQTGTAAAALEFLRTVAKADGAHASVIAANLRISSRSPGAVPNVLSRLTREGLVASVPDPAPPPRHGRRRYYAPEFAPAGWQDLPVAPGARRRFEPVGTGAPVFAATKSRALRLDPAAPATVPHGLQVTRCPGYRDTRYSVAPGEPVLGAGFVAQWKRLRRQRRAAP